jgi:hypothetical protein
MINEAFAPHDALTIDRQLSMEECARHLGFIEAGLYSSPANVSASCPRSFVQLAELLTQYISTFPVCVQYARQLPHFGDCARFSSPSRYSVFCADVPD